MPSRLSVGCPSRPGSREIGHARDSFCFDNETPRHRVYLNAFELASRPVTNGEYMEFMRDGAYERPELWLSDGWDARVAQGWSAPLYWEREGDHWSVFTLHGMSNIDPDEPVCHLSYYEADAYARWARARLPTEAEWETAAASLEVDGNFVESGRFHPAAQEAGPCSKCTVTCGSGRAAPISATRDFAPLQARWASTTASSW